MTAARNSGNNFHMEITTLLADPASIRPVSMSVKKDAITIVVKAVQKQSCCPQCHQPSAHRHSRYERTLADLPWHGVAIRLRLQTRRFFCTNELCRRRIFCERLMYSDLQTVIL